MEDSSTTDRLNFDRFDICRLLQHGASLLGSAGAEFEVQDEKSGIVVIVSCVSNIVGSTHVGVQSKN
jgi:hypothetical protein